MLSSARTKKYNDVLNSCPRDLWQHIISWFWTLLLIWKLILKILMLLKIILDFCYQLTFSLLWYLFERFWMIWENFAFPVPICTPLLGIICIYGFQSFCMNDPTLVSLLILIWLVISSKYHVIHTWYLILLMYIIYCTQLTYTNNVFQAIFLPMVPFFLPLVHMALMGSVYSTIIMSLERYLRLCKVKV